MIRHPVFFALIAVKDRLILAIYTILVTALVTANSLFTQQRMSHENGITCSGSVRLREDLAIPAHDFLRPGARFGCRVRHGAASFKDDAKLVVRSASLKFADTRYDSPFDLMMNTGDMPLFWNARTFVGFMWVTLKGRGKQFVSFLKAHPLARVGGGGAVRRNPESFGGMVYNTKTTTGFIGRDGVLRYARYRLQPADFDGNEDGAPDAFDRDHPWLQNPRRDETRDRNYLKKATRQQVNEEGKPLRYTLLLQLRDPPQGIRRPEWISSAVVWDEETFPFVPIADVVLDRALNYEESMLTWFDLGNHPDDLPILPARSIDDPNSLNHLRLASVWARRARLLSYRLRGMPPAFGDSRRDPDWEGIPPLRDPPPVGEGS